MKLTERRIERLTVEEGRRDRLVFDDTQRGLAVRITASGGRTYLVQYTLHGHKWRVPLGAYSAVSLAKAREAAAAVMGDVAKGRNPAANRKAAAAAERAKRVRARLTLRVLIEEWDRLHLSKQRASYAAEAVRALHRAFAEYLDDAAEDLDRASIVRTLDALTRTKERAKPGKAKGGAIAGRTAAYGRTAFGWALKRGMVTENPFLNLPISKGASKRERVLTDSEIDEIWHNAEKMTAPYGNIVRFLILTGQRRGEVAGLKWNELTPDLDSWILPGERTKNGVTHIVPLSKPARDILRSLLPEDEVQAKRIFAERRAKEELALPGLASSFAGWSKSKAALDKAILEARENAAADSEPAPMEPWTLHDIRRSVATGLQRLGVRLEVTEAVLNHISGSRGGIAGVYQRHDWANEKRAALDAWADHLITIADGNFPVSNVLRLAKI